MARAAAYSAFTAKSRLFARMAEHAHTERAAKHVRRRSGTRVLRAWGEIAREAKAARVAAALVDAHTQQAALDMRLVMEAQDRAAEQRAAAAAAAREMEAYQDFLRQAEAAAEVARQEALAAAARKTVTAKRLRDAQAGAHAAHRAAKRAAVKAEFDEEWAERTATECAEARVRVLTWLKGTAEGGEALKAEVQRLITMADSADNVSQEGSDFRAVFNPSDGCIHFIRDANPTAKVKRRDYNVDRMTSGEGQEVALAHLSARRAAEHRKECAREEAAAWSHAQQLMAAQDVQRWIRGRAARQAALTQAAMRLEILVEPVTLTVRYMHTLTGLIYQSKPAVFGSSFQVQDSPEWIYQAGDPASGGKGTYRNVPLPWLSSPSPPPSAEICSACGFAVATRICAGAGCEAALFCFPCFRQRHPPHSDHWSTFNRVRVLRSDELDPPQSPQPHEAAFPDLKISA